MPDEGLFYSQCHVLMDTHVSRLGQHYDLKCMQQSTILVVAV